MGIQSLGGAVMESPSLTAQKILELANKAYFLYVRANPTEQGEMVKTALLNSSTDGTSLLPTFRKPFDLIFQRAKSEDWLPPRDSNPDMLIQSQLSCR
jgi:hypothetical protein